MKKLMLQLWAIVLLTGACQSTSAEEVVLSQVEPWNAGDVEVAMEIYADDAFVKIQPAIPPGSPDQHSGKAELRAWFEDLVAMNFEMDLEVIEVDGNTVTTRTKTWVDPTREMGVAPLVATEVYTVEDGKITGWTWTLSDESLIAVQNAIAAAQAPQGIEATVTFDGEVCTYAGPDTVPSGTEILFNFEPTAKPDDVVMIVGAAVEGTTWEQFKEWADTTPGGSPPLFAKPGYTMQFGPGAKTVTLDALDYIVACVTAPEDTNENFAGGFINVSDT